MSILRFQGRYIEPILEGTKTSTIRKPRSGLPNAGEYADLYCRYGDPPFATARVTSTEELGLRDLTDRHASADGFKSVKALRLAIRELYPDCRRLVLIRFVLECPPTLWD